jgi:hypothetical protein
VTLANLDINDKFPIFFTTYQHLAAMTVLARIQVAFGWLHI